MHRPLAALMIVLALAATPLSAVSAADESLEITFNDHCRECHSFVKDDNRLGPTLYGVIGRKAGTQTGYRFTQSLKDSGVTWDEATLDKFIANPDQVVGGNNMKPFTGIAAADQRTAIIAFLKSISGK